MLNVFVVYAQQVSATSHGSVDQDEDLLDLEALIPGSCWLCKKIVTKVKKRLGSHEKAVSDKYHTM